MRKKPLPLTAMSSGLLVTEMLPWVNCWATLASFEPMPIWPAPAPVSEFANTSANWAWAPLKPTTEALATLLPITSRFLLDVFSPLNPDWNPISYLLPGESIKESG